MLPALIGAGASLLGGILGRNSEKKAIAAQNAYNDPAQIRARAEAAGFNPLLFVGPGVGNQMTTGGTNYMGSAIADAGMQIADQMSKNRELARLEKLSAENKKLAEKVQNLTIRPKVGGVYAQRESTPTIAEATSRTNDSISRPLVVSASGSSNLGVSSSADFKPVKKNTFEEYGNDGQVTAVPVGPDLDEVFTGSMIALTNKAKKWLNILAPDPYAGSVPSIDRVPPLTAAQKEKLARQKAARKALQTPTFTLPYYGGGF